MTGIKQIEKEIKTNFICWFIAGKFITIVTFMLIIDAIFGQSATLINYG